MHPRAIETRYKGYRFRSRLEARWAVFFDHLGLQWEYEPEGFELPGGVRYLPDFYLNERGVGGGFAYGPWVEVKAAPPSAVEVQKMGTLCEQTVCYGLIVWGPPGGNGWMYFHKEGVALEEGGGEFCRNNFPDHIGTCWREAEQAAEAARSARFEHGESGAR